MATENEIQQAQGSNNQGFNHANALAIRLQTQELLSGIKDFLTGYETQIYDKDGEILTQRVQIGQAKMNDVGIQAIMSRLSLIFHPAIVQGNYAEDRYINEVQMVRSSLSDAMMVNLHNWNILETDYEDIIDGIMTAVKGFMSRLIDNKERESYAATIKHFESNTMASKKSWIPFT